MPSAASDSWRRASQTSRGRNWRISKYASHSQHTHILQRPCLTDNNPCSVCLQRIFTDFITVEMLFHAKALEVYAHTCHNLEEMNIQKDLEVT